MDWEGVNMTTVQTTLSLFLIPEFFNEINPSEKHWGLGATTCSWDDPIQVGTNNEPDLKVLSAPELL